MLKIFVYVMIVIAIVLGASPYKLRDFFEWLYRSQACLRAFGDLRHLRYSTHQRLLHLRECLVQKAMVFYHRFRPCR